MLQPGRDASGAQEWCDLHVARTFSGLISRKRQPLCRRADSASCSRGRSAKLQVMREAFETIAADSNRLRLIYSVAALAAEITPIHPIRAAEGGGV